MKKILPVLAFLVLALPCIADAGWELVRGSGPQASFESSARPEVAVKAAPGFSTVAQGKMTVLLHEGNSLTTYLDGTVWYCLSAHGDHAQLAVALADAGGEAWYPGMLGSSLESAEILYSCGPERPGSVTQRVFVRQVQLDPWMQAFKAADAGWNGSLLVSQYEWLDSSSENKLLVEYREPLNSEKCPVIIPEELDKFIDRANVSFSARFAGEGHVEASSITPYPWNSENVSSRLLSEVLGAADRSAGSR
ncbi:MAG: DUF4851 domain-containing protein [Mailhella sp.]|nr:DUF4851 domain-containing protein [Mailhella sp.]